MIWSEDDRVAAVEAKRDPLVAAFSLTAHFDRAKGGGLHLDLELLHRRHQKVASVGFTPQYRCEQAHHGRPAARLSFMVPGTVACDAHSRITAMRGLPLLDRRQAAFVDHLLQIGEVQSSQLDRWAAFGHFPTSHCECRQAIRPCVLWIASSLRASQ